MEFHPLVEKAANTFKHTPLSATIASFDRGLVELLHAQLHIQLDELTTKEINPEIIVEIHKAVELLKRCNAYLKQEQIKTKIIKRQSRYGWSLDPQTDAELQEKYGDSVHKQKICGQCGIHMILPNWQGEKCPSCVQKDREEAAK